MFVNLSIMPSDELLEFIYVIGYFHKMVYINKIDVEETMNLKISSLLIRCKRENVFIPFSNNISFIYGNAGVGKSTLVNLVSYGLGNSIIKTLVVEQEILGVSINALIAGELYVIDRNMNSNMIKLKTKNGELSLVAKKKNKSQNSLSDYFYSIEGLTPVTMLRGNSSKEISVSFSNYMWFAYLRQEELDNTFFYLGDDKSNFKQLSSIYVLKALLEEKDVSETEINKEINLMKERLQNVNTKINLAKGIISKTRLSKINISHETVRKQKEVIRLRENIVNTLHEFKTDDPLVVSRKSMEDLLEKQRKLGMYEAEVKYLQEFGYIQNLIVQLVREARDLNERIAHFENIKKETSNQQFEDNIKILETIFFQCLRDVEFSYLDASDHVRIDRKTLIPSVYSKYNQFKFDYSNLSSGGKKTIFKICFALSIHIFATQKASHTLLPHFIIVDTPMKNMSEREDNELYDRLYCFFNNLFSENGILKDVQLIVIDKELPTVFQDTNVVCKHLTNEMPLIPYLNK